MSPTSRHAGRPVKSKPKSAKPATKKSVPARKKSVHARPAAKPVKKDRIVREKKTTSKVKPAKAAAAPVKKKPVAASAPVRKTLREVKVDKPKSEKIKPVKAAPEKPVVKLPVPEKRSNGRKRKAAGATPLEEALRENDPLLEPDALEPEVFDPEAPLLEPDALNLDLVPEALLPADDVPIEDLDLPIDLWDAEIIDVPRPATAPKPPKPKPPKADKRQQTCANCGGTFTWISVDGYCFSCLKRKVAQKRREDETFSGYTHDADDDDSD